jgi:cation diffusion facilitator CzcD-associated flavoprotein CzcO
MQPMDNTQRNNHRVIVVGAGANGLAVAHALRQRAIPVTIIEKAKRPGDAWYQRHPQLSLNTHRDLSQLPGMAPLTDTAAFPTRVDTIRYLTEYARRLDVPIDYGVTVTRIDRSGGAWSVITDAGVYNARHVVIATGLDRVPFIPDWQGREAYRGKLLHAADFGELGKYSGKKVLVVGCGNSGSDILNHLSTIDTERVYVSVRHGPIVFPRYLYGIPVQRLSPVLSKLPVRIVDALLALTQFVAFGDLRKWGLPRIERSGATRLIKDGIAPAIDDGFVQALKDGRIEVVPAIHSFAPTQVELSDSRCLDVDVVIAATGYRTGLESLLGKTELLDDSGTPVIDGAQQHDAYPGLWFCGMRPRLPGFFYMAQRTSTEIATAIAASSSDDSASAAPEILNYKWRMNHVVSN